MIPGLDALGLLPPGVHDCTMAEIEERFAWNDRRATIFAGLQRFIAAELVAQGLTFPLYVDGSFVRIKDVPDDVDIVLDLTTAQPLQLVAGIALCVRRDEMKSAYTVDPWLRHPTIPSDLVSFFQYTGEKAAAELSLPILHRKGILRVALP